MAAAAQQRSVSTRSDVGMWTGMGMGMGWDGYEGGSIIPSSYFWSIALVLFIIIIIDLTCLVLHCPVLPD